MLLILGLPHELPAQVPAEPSGPQSFVAGQKEPAGFAFFATQPGPISVSVQSPDPVAVTLSGPIAQAIQKAGAGNVQIEYAATPADVQHSPRWFVHVVPASGPGPVQGTVTIAHPPADPRAVTAAVEEMRRRMQAARDAAPANLAKLKASLEAQHAAEREQHIALQKAKAEELVRSIRASAAVQSRGVTALKIAPQSLPAVPIAQPPAATSLPPAHSAAPLPTINPPPPPPQITSLSANSGEPGDWIAITGVNLGTSGQVYLVSPGGAVNLSLVVLNDVYEQGACYWSSYSCWSPTTIVVSIPLVTGLYGFAGSIYVAVAGQNSNLLSFQFNPTIVTQSLIVPYPIQDEIITNPNSSAEALSTADHTDYSLAGGFSGHKNNDQFYMNTVLAGGWTVVSANVVPTPAAYFGDSLWGPGGNYVGDGSYVIASRPTTASLYTEVHWWEDAGWDAGYNLVINIQGPAGTNPGPLPSQ